MGKSVLGKWLLFGSLSFAGFVLILTALFLARLFCWPHYHFCSTPPVAFAGDSANCRATVVVPTLDTPMPKARNVIWCGAFQLACEEFKAGFGPLKGDAVEIFSRLNNSSMNRDDLPDNSYYAVFGTGREGITGKIQRDMERMFPKVSPHLPPLENADNVLAYAYLSANPKFHTPFSDRKNGDEFVDSAGQKTHVSSFGLYEKESPNLNRFIEQQIGVLYVRSHWDHSIPPEFSLDLDKTSQPNQLILACVEPKDSLAATWEDLQQKIKMWNPIRNKNLRPYPEDEFSYGDSLAVPNINFKIEHQFKELEKLLGQEVFQGVQRIDFLLDRNGSAFTNEAGMILGALGRDFWFTKPFLVVMKKRGAAQPYFLMWVDNAELLCKY